jgi:parallel beta-helix repeat protein
MQILIENNNFIDLQTDLGVSAVMLNGSKITFRNNILTGSSYGITILGSSNIISENTIECILPIQMDNVNLNIISMNKISGPVRWVGQDPFTGNEGIALFNSVLTTLSLETTFLYSLIKQLEQSLAAQTTQSMVTLWKITGLL